MSTVRIQNRRGTAAEWTSINPILAAGELGLESDTNYIKFGNGVDHWSTLGYANEPLLDLQNTLADYVLLSDVAQPNGVASLNSSGKIPATQLEISEITQDVLDSALIAGANIVKTYDDTANTLTVAVDDSIVLTGDLTVEGISTVEALTVNGNLTVNGTTTTVSTANFTTEDALIYIGEGNQSNSVDLGIVASFNDGTYQHSGLVRDASDGVWKLFSGVVPEPGTTVDFTTHTKDALEVGSFSATNAVIGNVNNQEIQYLDGVTSSIQTQIDTKLASSTAASTYAPISNPSFSGTVTGVSKAMVGLANVDNTSDENKPVSTATLSALDLKANLEGPTFTGNVILPSTTAIGNVSATELNYLNGVTSALQTQLDSKLNTSSASSIYAPLSDATFLGTIVLPSTTSIGTVSATEIGYLDGVTSGIQTQLGTAATNLSNHTGATTSVHGIADTSKLVATTDTGTVTSTMIENGTIVNADINTSAAIDWTKLAISSTVSSTELGYIDGVTSSIQTQLDSKLASATAASTYAPIADPTFTGTVTVNNLTVSGTTTTVNSTNLTVSDPLIYIGTGNGANLNELGIVGAYNDGSHKHTGLVKDHSDGKWKLFSGITTEPGTSTIDLTGAAYDTIKVGGVEFSDGAQTKQGVPSITPIISKTSSYTLSALTERDSMIEVSSSSATTITIPTNSAVAFPIGASIDISQISTGQVTIAGDTGVTVNATPGLKLRTQWSTATLFKRGTDSWIVYGDLTA